MISTKIHNRTNQKKENKYQPKLKKKVGHKKLTKSCHTYTDKALLIPSLLPSEVSTRYEPTPINTYRMVQTMGNKMAGGESGGLVTIPYSCMLPRVNKEDNIPTASGSAMHSTSKKNLFFIYFLTILLYITSYEYV